jgi:hypothetical protein
VLWYNVKDQRHLFSAPAYRWLAWAAVGLVVALAATTAARRTRVAPAEKLELRGPDLAAAPAAPANGGQA